MRDTKKIDHFALYASGLFDRNKGFDQRTVSAVFLSIYPVVLSYFKSKIAIAFIQKILSVSSAVFLP